MNDFDKAARRAVKDAPEDHVGWLFPKLAGALVYDDWLDAQSAPRPGEPDRRCDTIARLLPPGGLGPAWAAVVELFADADPDALDRTARYVWTYRQELRYGPDRYRMAAALVFQTDAPRTVAVEDELPGGESRFVAGPRVVKLAAEDAVDTMARIRDNRLGPGILPWVPLMQGGQSHEAAVEWRALLEEKVPLDYNRRAKAGLAWVLAELTGCQGIWEKALEGFAVRESTVMRRERDEGRIEAKRADLAVVLKARFKDMVPASLLEKVKDEDRIDRLTSLLAVAATEDLAAVEKAMGE